MKIAIPLKYDRDAVLLDDGRTVSRIKAEREGYTIEGSGTQSGDRKDAIASWQLAIECLPEARNRKAATAELIARHDPESLSIDQARGSLRGLPEEIEQLEQTMTTTTDDPKAARLAEIERSMNAFNRNNGYAGKDLRSSIADIDPVRLHRLAEIKLNAMNSNGRSMTSDFKKLKLALDTYSRLGGDFSRVLAEAGVDAQSLVSKIA